MPSFLRPSAQRCRDFLSHPNAYVAHIPTGDDIYFTLPFDLSSLHPMRPQELEALHDFLDTIQNEVAESLGNHTLENVLQVQFIISRWLENARCLGDLEIQGWMAGYGFPVFDEFQYPVDFHWDWNVIEFEGLSSRYFNLVHPASAGSISHSIYRTPINYASLPPNTSDDLSPYGSVKRNRMHSESGRLVSMHGGAANTNEILEFLDLFIDDEIASLKEKIIQLEGDIHHGIHGTRGPNADPHFEQVSQASWFDVESIKPTKIQDHDNRTKDEAKKGFLWLMRSWESFYQQGLISYHMTAKTNTLVPSIDLYWLKLYKAMRDMGLSEKDALKTVMDVRRVGPSSLSERPMRNGHSPWGEERSTYTSANEPGYFTPEVTIRQAMPDCQSEEFTEEHHILPEGRTEQVQDPGHSSERCSRIVQPSSNRKVDQSAFTSYAESQHGYYMQTPPAHRQSAIVYKRDPLLSSRRESERMAQIKAAKSLSESKKKELNRTHSKAETQDALNALAMHENKKAKGRSRQNTTQQATRFQDHDQQAPSSSYSQETIKKCDHTPDTVHQQALGPRSTINSVNPNAYRTRSFQEPARLSMHPRAATRPSGYHAGLNDSDRPKPHRPSYQAYAEDSPEDSPRAEPGSWRDV